MGTRRDHDEDGDEDGGWRRREVDGCKREVKAELDRLAGADGPARLRLALERAAALAGAADAAAQLRRLVYVVSALAQHERAGGLTEGQVHRLAALADAILAARGVRPVTSKLAFLHGELHLVLSQIHRKTGRPWDAAWEQQVAAHLSRRAPVGGEAFQALAGAIRALRLGHATLAIREFARVEAAAVPARSRIQARLGRVKALRLAGRPVEAAALAAAAATDLAGWGEAERLELAWERWWCDAVPRLDLSPLVAAVRPRGSHRRHVYLVDAFLAAQCAPTRAFVERLPAMRSVARDKRLAPQKLGAYFTAASVVDRCYDYRAPLATRLRDLGRVLRRVRFLVSVDKELLVWGAAARWLARSHSLPLATLALSEYRALSLRLSEGRCADALGILGDMLGRDWFVAGDGGEAGAPDGAVA